MDEQPSGASPRAAVDRAGAGGSDVPAARREPEDEDDEGGDQEQVDEPTQHEAAEQTERPEHEQDEGDRDQHEPSQLFMPESSRGRGTAPSLDRRKKGSQPHAVAGRLGSLIPSCDSRTNPFE